MKIESLKEKARRHEQSEDWAEALDLYLQAIDSVDPDEGDVDVGLYNRVGDLEVRLGRMDQAMEHYEQAADLYVESGLPNNAIAICKKVIRNVPERDSIYLKMGKIRAEQGFITDARQSFLTYAERKQGAGDLEEAFRALVEFVDLVPDDTEIRLALAGQLAQHDRVEEAVEQFSEARRRLILQGDEEKAEAVTEQIQELDPDAGIEGVDTIRAQAPAEEPAAGDDEGWGGDGFSDFALGGEDEEEEAAVVEPADELDVPEDEEEEEEEELEVGGLEGFDIAAGDGEDEEEEEVAPLPGLDDSSPDFGDEAEEEEEVEPAALEREDALEEAVFEERLQDEDAAVQEEDAGVLEQDEVAEEGRELEERSPESYREEGERLLSEGRTEEAMSLLERAHEALARRGDARQAAEVVRRMTQESPEDVELHQRVVEYAYRAFDQELLSGAYLGLADALRRSGQEKKAETAYRQALDADPDNAEASRALAELSSGAEAPADARPEVASSEEYVDLGAMILDDEAEEKSTRFVVAAEAPSGDEEADFAKMLDQFKEKVAENVDTGDVAAHYDLGTAYKEMGLVDEAIGEFQAALRAARHHLPTYEMLGQCFLEKGQNEAALKALGKALDAPYEVEDELLGIYYYLGRAYEEVGREDEAVEYYDRVFALDINFMDVTERLRTLR